MPVGPSQGASGHEAIGFQVFTSITWMVFFPSLLTKIRPLPSAAAPSGAVSSSSTVATMSPLFGSIAVRVPIGRLWLVRMILSSASSNMMPSRPGPTLICRSTASVLRSNIVTVWSPLLVVKPWPAAVAKPAPWTPGVFWMSPSTLPVAPSTTIRWVERDTNTRPVAASTAT